MSVIGLDLGATKLASALFSIRGDVLCRRQAHLGARTGAEVGDLVLQEIDALAAEARARGETVRAVGVSVPGIARQEKGSVWAPNIPGWDDYPLRPKIGEHLDFRVPVAIDSDRACSIMAEVAEGAARGCSDAIFVAVGTGIGAGIMCGGRVLRGAHDIAGAIGWMALERPYRSDFDRCGCFESNASGAGIESVARRWLAERPDVASVLREAAPGGPTTADVFDAYGAGDALAAAVIANAVQCWGMATANLVSLFNPEVIVFGGGVFGPAVTLVDRIAAEARRWAQPISMQRVRIAPSALGPEACLIGTGRLALTALGQGAS